MFDCLKKWMFPKKYIYLPLQAAKMRLYEELRFCDEVKWSEIGVTRNTYLQHQLMMLINYYEEPPFYLYGSLTLGSYSKKISIIPKSLIPSLNNGYTAWNEDYTKIRDFYTNELYCTNICVKEEDLKKAIQDLKSVKEFIPNQPSES